MYIYGTDVPLSYQKVIQSISMLRIYHYYYSCDFISDELKNYQNQKREAIRKKTQT